MSKVKQTALAVAGIASVFVAVSSIVDAASTYTVKQGDTLSQLADKFGYEFINVNDGLADENGDLLPKLTFDGVHMFPAGYEIVLKNMYRYL